MPFEATPKRETPGIPEWAQPHVWTDRMLTTLLTGVRGGKWHTLIDKVYSLDTLLFAAASAFVVVVAVIMHWNALSNYSTRVMCMWWMPI